MAANEEIDILIKTKIDAADSAKTLGELKKSMRDLNDLSLQIGEDSPESFNKVKEAAGQAAKKISEMKQATKAVSGEPVERLAGSFKLAGENLKSLDFGNATQALSLMSSTIKGMSFGALTSGLKGFTSQVYALGKAILSNPIFLLAAVIIAIGAAIYGLLKYFGVIDKLVQMFNDLTDAIGITHHALDDLTKKTLEHSKFAADAIKDKYDQEIELAQAAGQETHDLEIAKTKDLLEQIDIQMQALWAKRAAEGKLTEDEEKELETARKAHNKLLNDINVIDTKYKKKKDDKKKEDDKKSKEDSKKRIDDAKKALDKQYQDYIDTYNKKAALDKQMYDQVAKNQANELELTKTYSITKDQLDEKFTQTRLANAKLTDDQVYALIQKNLADEKAAQDEKNNLYIKDQEEKNAALKTQEDNYKKEADLKLQFKKTQEQIDADYEAAQKAGITDVYAYLAQKYKEDVDNHKKAQDEKTKQTKEAFDIAKGLAGALNAIGELVSELDSQRTDATLEEKNAAAKKEFNLKKGLGIVNAAINTAEGITQALANPFPLNIVMAALAGVTGAIQIATIAAKKFTPESPSSASGAVSKPPTSPSGLGSAGQTPQAPSFFGLGQNNIIKGQQGNQATKVYVTETDITNSQNRVSVIQNRSVMGH